MAIIDDLDNVWESKSQSEDLFTARAALENATNVIEEELQKFKDIKASGSFSTIPIDLRNALLAWEIIYDTAKASFLADADVVAIPNWRP